MPINPNIALGVQAPQVNYDLLSPMNALRIQALVNQNKMSQAQFDEYTRQLKEEADLRTLLQGGQPQVSGAPAIPKPAVMSPTQIPMPQTGMPMGPETMGAIQNAPQMPQQPQANALAATVTGANKNKAIVDLTDPNFVAQIAASGKAGRDFIGRISEVQKARTEEATRAANLQAARGAQYVNLLQFVNNQQDALKWIQMQQQDPAMAGSPIANVPMMQAASSIPADPAGFAQWKQQAALGLGKYIEQNKPQYFQQDFGGTKRIFGAPGLGGPGGVVPGSEGKVTMTPAEAANIGLRAREVKLSEYEKSPEGAKALAAAKATGEAIAKDQTAARAALPALIDQTNQSLKLIDDLVGKEKVVDKNGNVLQEATAPHPGFNTAVGKSWLLSKVPLPTDAYAFGQRLEQIKSQDFLNMYQTLRGAGAISDAEGKKATAALDRMNLATDKKEFISAANDLRDVLRSGVTRVQKRAGAVGANTGGNEVDANNPLLK